MCRCITVLLKGRSKYHEMHRENIFQQHWTPLKTVHQVALEISSLETFILKLRKKWTYVESIYALKIDKDIIQ